MEQRKKRKASGREFKQENLKGIFFFSHFSFLVFGVHLVLLYKQIWGVDWSLEIALQCGTSHAHNSEMQIRRWYSLLFCVINSTI